MEQLDLFQIAGFSGVSVPVSGRDLLVMGKNVGLRGDRKPLHQDRLLPQLARGRMFAVEGVEGIQVTAADPYADPPERSFSRQETVEHQGQMLVGGFQALVQMNLNAGLSGQINQTVEDIGCFPYSLLSRDGLAAGTSTLTNFQPETHHPTATAQKRSESPFNTVGASRAAESPCPRFP
jgi:hypothetical protein